ncbi:RNA 3'-terminal phosphate cyclase, partial [Halobacterium salinarum]|uniref:RNA 3'-terminal phosphate cyclase n=1 Tax=Halobacterium salinarum TaxID=2242 RepID=UPI001F1BBAF7
MHVLDGSSGGGQLVRTALTCAAVSGESFRMRYVRRARSNPGLQAQHCAAVNAVADICDAATDGVEVGSEAFSFEPEVAAEEADDDEEPTLGGTTSVEVGTAGSIPLVFDSLLPLAGALDEPITATLTGGTDAKWAPPMDYFQHVKLPLLREHGIDATVSVDRRGFYPRGGGEATLTVEPSTPTPITLTERGDREALTAYSVAESSLADDEVAEQQATAAAPDAAHEIAYADADSAGSAVVLAAEYEHSRAGFAALGERGVSADAVGENAADAHAAFESGPGAVDSHLADQLVPVVAVAGGEVRAPEVTTHVETCVDLLAEFDYDIGIEHTDDGAVVLSA